MALFSQIKNFIKSSSSKNNATESNISRRSTIQKYETAQRIVEKENIAKRRLPTGLDNYSFEEKLGDGAFSKVYRASKNDTHEKVAIKIVSKSELNKHQKASVLKEVQIMRTLDHPSIVKLLDFVETKEHYFLVLELCPGGELFKQIVRLTYFSEELSRHVITQVAKGIRYLHEERGVVHRDIKPENLLFMPIEFKARPEPLQVNEFDEPKEDEGVFIPGIGGGGIGAVKIADFGLSKVVWDQQTMTPCGTVGYTAPEVVLDQRYSKSVDMWALGCVLYTLLCGFPPFYDENISVLTDKVSKGQYTFLSPWWDNISDEVKHLIENLLCVDPEKRYTILEFLDHPWIKNEKMPEMNKEEIQARTSPPEVTLDRTTPLVTSIEETGVPLNGPKPETEAEAFKRMVQERILDEEELEAAVPIAVPSGVSSVINSRANSRPTSMIASSASTPRRDLFSGVSSMKEMFDISYTVHRLAEEKQRKKNLRANPPDPNANRRSLFMNAINGDSSSDDDEADMIEDETSSSSQTTTNEEDEDTAQHGVVDHELEQMRDKLNVASISERIDIPQKHHVHKSRGVHKSNRGGMFELNMDKSTLLGRRRAPTPTLPTVDQQQE